MNSYSRALADEYIRSKKWSESIILGVDDSAKTARQHVNHGSDELIATSFDHKIGEYLISTASAFEDAKRKIGTIELSTRQYRSLRVKRRIEHIYESIDTLNKEWGNTVFALFEDWRLDLDFYIFKEIASKKFNQTHQLSKEAIESQVIGNFESLQNYLADLSYKLAKADQSSISIVLKEGSYHISKFLIDQQLPAAVEKISSQNILNALSHLDQSIKEQASIIAKSRIITSSDKYDLPLQSTQLHSISPYELVSFSLLPKFENQLNELKGDIFEVIEETVEDISTVGQTLLFSYQSALEQFQEDPTINYEAAVEVADEGLERVRSRLQDLQSNVNDLVQEIGKTLQASISDLSTGLLDLTINQNIFELRVALTKAKTIQKARGVRTQFKSRIDRIVKLLKEKGTSLASRGRDLANKVGNRFILTAKKPVASRAVSDFLIESQTAIDELPLVYRKLFKIEPIDNIELVEGREKEIETITTAYANWQKGRFASTVITGEKWGGKTSLINYAREKAGFTHKVQIVALTNAFYDLQSLYSSISSAFGQEEISEQKEIIEYLNERPRTIIVVEDVQNLFLKKVGGFALIRELLEIITKTEQNIYWITTCTKYAWNYLVKTISIDQFFSYNIHLEEVSEEQIISIISRRNKVSGFQIRFDPPESLKKDKKFQKMDDSEQQSQLKKSFFKALHDYSKSNITMSLLFWLLSTKSIDKREVNIGTFEPPDLNFINILSGNTLFILYALILHDGLNQAQLQEATRIERTSLELQLHALLEDGLLYQREDAFFVNPLVYRNTVSLLKSRNLIH